MPSSDPKLYGLDNPAGIEALRRYFGVSFPEVAAYAELLVREGELRGLLGPREADRIWDRHIVNSAALANFLPETGSVGDIGSGAGLPGIVLAAMKPELQFKLIEPMERRCDWLSFVAAEIKLANVEVIRSRVEDLNAIQLDAATARAVAPVRKLVGMTLPVLRPGCPLFALKGRSVQTELDKAQSVLTKLPIKEVEIARVDTIEGMEPATVLIVRKSS